MYYNWPQRKPLRLKNYNYSQNWFYFVTICTKWRQNYFGEIINWEMILNNYGKIAKKFWDEIIYHYQNVEIDEFVIMPNHIHWIIIIVGNEYFRSDDLNENHTNEYFRSDNLNENQTNENNGNENIRSLRKTNLSNVIKWFKIWCTKEIREKFEDFEFAWQKSFFDKIIKNDEQLNKTREYIINNPLKWEFDKNNPINIK